MATDVSWMPELDLQPGRETDFTVLMNEMVTATRANEAGTLNYEWSTSADGKVCHVFERYVDSAAVMTHLAAFAEKFAVKFLEVLKPTRFVVYGSPSQEVKGALAGYDPVYMRPVGGFRR
jgi:quinol monooxygenase YgiN